MVKKFLSMSFVLFSFLFSIMIAGTANAVMVAHYKFEGNANDSSGNNLHGIGKGNICYVAGVSGQAIELDGKDSYMVDCKADAAFDIGNQITVVACAILSPSIEIVNAIPGEEHLPQLSCEELICQLAMSERKLSNLKVQSEYWVERREPNSQNWQPTPVYASCTAWFDGEPNGRARIDVHKEVLEWKDGAAPFSEASYSVAFDGQYGRRVYHAMGPFGQARKIRKGVIYPEAPKDLRSKWLGGTSFSMFFLFDQLGCPRGKRLSDYLNEFLSQFGPFSITCDAVGDTKCIRLGGGEPEGGHEFLWLDPARGFALLRYEIVNVTKDGRKWLSESQTVTTLTESAPGLWCPTEAYAESTTSPGLERTNRRVRYLASEVVANDPNFDESIFTLTFPAGYFIYDKVKVVGDPTGEPNTYTLYDDDEGTYSGGTWTITPLLPSYPSLGSWDSSFYKACIQPTYLPESYRDEVPFDRNLSSSDVAWGSGSWNDQCDCPSSSSFWTVLAVGAFQPQTGNDNDPDDEERVAGAAKVYFGDNQCVLYYETIKDGPVTDAGQDLAHEIGHGAGIEDNSCELGCLMWVDQNNQLGDHFCDKCLLEMRKDTSY